MCENGLHFTHVQYTAVAVHIIAYFSFFARNLMHLYEEIGTYGQTPGQPHAVVYAESMCEELRYDEINDPTRGQDLDRSVYIVRVSSRGGGRGGGGGGPGKLPP